MLFFLFQISLMVRVVFFAMIFICNGMMWTLFTKSLQFCSSTAEVTVTNTASNFLVSVSNFLVSVTTSFVSASKFLVNVSNLITLYCPNRQITNELVEMVEFMVQNFDHQKYSGSCFRNFLEYIKPVTHSL